MLKLTEIVILWVYYTIPFGFSLVWHFWGITFQLLNYFVWLRITDEGSIPEIRIRSILLIKSDLKWCIHLSRGLFSYFEYAGFKLNGDPATFYQWYCHRPLNNHILWWPVLCNLGKSCKSWKSTMHLAEFKYIVHKSFVWLGWGNSSVMNFEFINNVFVYLLVFCWEIFFCGFVFALFVCYDFVLLFDGFAAAVVVVVVVVVAFFWG